MLCFLLCINSLQTKHKFIPFLMSCRSKRKKKHRVSFPYSNRFVSDKEFCLYRPTYQHISVCVVNFFGIKITLIKFLNHECLNIYGYLAILVAFINIIEIKVTRLLGLSRSGHESHVKLDIESKFERFRRWDVIMYKIVFRRFPIV